MFQGLIPQRGKPVTGQHEEPVGAGPVIDMSVLCFRFFFFFYEYTH